MTDRATHEMVVSFIREFQAKQDEWTRQLLDLSDRIHQIAGRMADTESLVKSFSGRLNGMESRLDDKVPKAALEASLQALDELKIAHAGSLALQQLANRSIRDWVYSSDFDREFALVTALEATL